MKRIIILLGVLLFSMKCFSAEMKFESLNSEEYFSLEYSKGILEVYKTSDNEKELYFTTETIWGTYQLSKDKKQLLVYSEDDKMFYLLDGIKGSYNPLTKKPKGSRTSFDFKYIIWEEDFDISIDDRTKMPQIVITRLDNEEDLLKITWEELEEYYKEDYSFGYLFIRSDDPDYDFYVYAKGEGRDRNLGMMKINIEKKLIEKEEFYGKKVVIPDYPDECYGF